MAAAAVATAGLLAATIATRASADDPPAITVTVTTTTTTAARYQGKPIRWWARRTAQARRDANTRALTIRRLKRTLAYDPTVLEAIALASVVYRVDHSTLLRKARCESHLYPLARNRYSNASGLFQFLPSTFNSTPFARFSIWSPYANALAAGWMHGPAGRAGEWACR